MKLLRSATQVFVDASGNALKLQDDNYVEPKPDVLQIEVEVDAGQVITLPTINSFYYLNTSGINTSSGTLVYDYMLDWGDGSTIDHVTTYNSPLITHTYVTKGKYVIEITSATQKFPAWDCQAVSGIRLYITRVISWGNVGLKRFNLYGCTALVTLPEQRSKLTTLLTAQYFCSGCTSLTSIPYGIFFKTTTADIVIADFTQAFTSCAKLLSINSELFRDCTEARYFSNTFNSCVKLTIIPDELFYTCTKASTFDATFQSCTLISAIPATLFLYNTAATCSFASTFYGCSSIPSVPAGLFDTVHGSTFYQTFAYCSSIVTIPEYLFIGQNIATTFRSVFIGCSKLQGVPMGVFDISVGGINMCTDMSYAFQSCGTDGSVTTFTIANNLFDDLYKVTTFNSTFNYCTKFVGIPNNLFINCVAAQYFTYTFSQNKHTSIPNGLFSTCTEVISFSGCFYSNSQLISSGIPGDLFANCTKATSFGDTSYGAGTFQNCNNVGFTYIPSELFSNCYNATSFRNTFAGCTYLAAIPTDLLRYNTVVTDVYGMFSSTRISSLSANVFQYNRSITTVSYCFQGCSYLTSIDADLFNTYAGENNAIVDFSNCFNGCNNVALTSIPENLFKYSINAKLFTATFQNCTGLTSLPAGLFAFNTIIENLSYCFYGCTFSAIPDALFSGLTQVSTVAYCFAYCNNLLSIPATLFASIGGSRTVTFNYCFVCTSTNATYNKITGAVPELWTKPNSPIGTGCFRNRTAVSNYASIPAAWK